MNSKPTASPEIQMIDVNLIRPNQFNPNQMTEQQFRECVAEIKHLGGLPHPIVVRPIKDDPDGKQYEIVDGEHRYRAAIELGLTNIAAVILEIDEHEAMRQCYKRNRGGRDNKVKLGQMFEKMQTGRGLSRRQLAKEINVSESTLRVAEDYARAAQVRTACAPETAEFDIARLSHPQVAHYRNLPSSVRDKWLDAGAHLSAFENRSKFTGDMLAGCLHEFGLAPYLLSGFDFVDSIQRLAGLVEWCDKHRQVAGVAQYAQAVAELQLSAQVINAVPFRREGDKLEVAIALPVWRNAIKTLRATSGTRNQEIIGA
ncbi:MAG: ParB N-terminal domain-containing protein, partial [Pirellulales bacterium]|nr:ParB N-terminal domain-containing protein [Pirellulales bacterium]